jgi:hypothetical protein
MDWQLVLLCPTVGIWKPMASLGIVGAEGRRQGHKLNGNRRWRTHGGCVSYKESLLHLVFTLGKVP